MTATTDYFVKGCGASAMSFVDTMLRETDATFTIVDKRAAPGGHWNDAYPFVRLHQPSSNYGVTSRPLGHGRRDETGFNKGLYELASGIEVTDYFHQVMRDAFLPTGRVSYHPLSEVVSDEPGKDAEFVSLMSGERHRVTVKKKMVDGTPLQTSVPLTPTRKFEVADGVDCIPPNDLTRMAPGRKHVVVMGSGKTGIDSVLWLLANGANPDAISWIVPRDPWFLNRVGFQPGPEYFGQAIRGLATQYEIFASATSVQDLTEKMAAAGLWLRLDEGVWPTMFHGATVTELELEQLRRVKNIIRKGRVQRIEADRIVLTEGEVAAQPDSLYVDCTARGLAGNLGDGRQVFSPGQIRLQMIRVFQPTFSSSLIAHIEATVADEADKQRLAQPTPMTDTPADWIGTQAINLMNQSNWMGAEGFAGWIAGNRLDLYTKQAMQLAEDDVVTRGFLERMTAAGPAAAQNLFRLSQAAAAG